MSDEGADETCDQTGLNSGQEDKAPDKPEESVLHQHDAGCGPSTKPSASATSAASHNGSNHLEKTSDSSSNEDNPSVSSKNTNDDRPAGKSKDISKPPVNSNITSSNEDNPSVSSKETSTNDDKPAGKSKDTSSNKDKPPVNSTITSRNGNDLRGGSNNTSSNGDNPSVIMSSNDNSSNDDKPSVNSKVDTSSTGDNPPTSSNNTSCKEGNHPTSNKDTVTSSSGDNPQASSSNASSNEDKLKPPVNSNTPSNRDKPPESCNNTSSNEEKPSVESKNASSDEDQPVVNRADTSNNEGNPPMNSKDSSSNRDKPPESSNNTSSNEEKPSVKSMDASSDEDQPVVNCAGTSNNEGNPPMNIKDSSSNDERPSVNSRDSSSKGDIKPPGRKRRSEQSGYFGGSMFAWLQSAGNAAIGEISEGIAAIGAKMFEEPEESIPPQDDVECSQSAEANASESPTNAPASNNGKNPPVNSKDDTCSDEDRVDTSGHEDKLPVNSEGTSSNVDKPSGNIMNTSSVGEEDSKPQTKKDLMRYAVVGVAAGTAAVVAAPLVLGAAGFAGTGVAVGSIAAATIKTGGLFAMAASNAAIGGITGGIAALGAKMFDSFVDIKLLICGSGSEAHAFAGIASSVKGTDVRVFSLNQDEADYWFAATRKNELKVTFHRKGEEPTCITSRPPLETSNPEDAMQDIDIVVFVLPAFAHQVLLYTLKPYIKPGTVIVGLPGAPGFEFQVHHVLGDVGQQCTIVNFESSPWVSCIFDLSVGCEVLGTKETLLGAIKQGKGAAPKKDPVSTLQYLLGPLPKLNVSGHLLGVQLMSANAYLHTSILFGQWEGWQGKPVDEPPLFYNGLTEPAADLLSSISDEIVKIARLIELKTEADLSHVVHIHLWLVRRYSHDISNKSSLYKAIQTNAAFQGIKHPVKTTEDGKFVPDFTHRYMAEDVPYGLVVIRGIAEIVGVETPNIDKVLTWCQEQMGKEYLVNSKLQGKDVGLSTAPQRYGFTTLESIL